MKRQRGTFFSNWITAHSAIIDMERGLIDITVREEWDDPHRFYLGESSPGSEGNPWAENPAGITKLIKAEGVTGLDGLVYSLPDLTTVNGLTREDFGSAVLGFVRAEGFSAIAVENGTATLSLVVSKAESLEEPEWKPVSTNDIPVQADTSAGFFIASVPRQCALAPLINAHWHTPSMRIGIPHQCALSPISYPDPEGTDCCCSGYFGENVAVFAGYGASRNPWSRRPSPSLSSSLSRKIPTSICKPVLAMREPRLAYVRRCKCWSERV